MKKLLSILLCTVLILSIIPTVLTSATTLTTVTQAIKNYENQTGEKVETNRYYFLMPNGENGTKIDGEYLDSWYNEESSGAGIYWWDSGIADPQAWPGYKMSKHISDDVYYADVPKQVTTLIFNNTIDGGMDKENPIYYLAQQTVNVPCEYYDPDENPLYPDGTDSFDNMIYVPNSLTLVSEISAKTTANGEWYYYYGNGCYGTKKDGDQCDCIRDDHNHNTDPNSSHISVKEAVSQHKTQTGEILDTNRYFFLMPDGTNGNTGTDSRKGEFVKSWYNNYTNTASIYWWSVGVCDPEFFPGYTMENGDTENVFYADVPTEVPTIIFNNNVYFSYLEEILCATYNQQSINVPCEYYDAGESPNYPDGTDSFDNMIYVLSPCEIYYGMPSLTEQSPGEWYYYYGNGCYGTKKDGDSTNCIHPSHFDSDGNHIAESFVLGDADNDSVLSVMDATHIQVSLSNLVIFEDFKAEFICDFDKDKTVSVMDATAIQFKLANLS